MKNIYILLATLASMAISTIGCKKSDSDSQATPSYSLSANIGGTATTLDSCIYSSSSTNLEIFAQPSSSHSSYFPQIYLYITSGYHGVGTYAMTNPGTVYAQMKTSYLSGELANTGSITITGTSPNLVGTFDFTTASGIIVSGGIFSATTD